MALSKSTKIWIFLVADTLFFLLEITVGYAVHSLALVADSFHMLNDVLSLCVGLWAVKVATERPSSKTFTYGWSRAETLGALINGVFLVALCLSIFLEAIQRFVEPQEVNNPKLVLVVGCFGLLFNILGLFLFHEHSHSHADEEPEQAHSHDHLINAEEGHSHKLLESDGKIEHVNGNHGSKTATHPAKSGIRTTTISFAADGSPIPDTDHAITAAKPSTGLGVRSRRARASSRASDQIPIHPASFRNDIIAKANMDPQDFETSSDQDSEDGDEIQEEEYEPSEISPLIKRQSSKNSRSNRSNLQLSNSITHIDHKHAQSSHGHGHGGHSHGHSHGDMNMKGIFLHVLGDALGNVGVIASALVIWLTNWSFRFYFDPLISLCITVIILLSAIPLCKASSKILLQATPQHISVDDIRDDIESLPGVKSCHHMHVWQLTPQKLIASLHVQVNFDFQGEGAARYMHLAKSMRGCLHGYGIHSSTIQPEFCLDPEHEHNAAAAAGIPTSPSTDDTAVNGGDGHKSPKNGKGRAAKSEGCGSGHCLLECPDSCASGPQCCPPGSAVDSGTATPKPSKEHDTK